ncbi:LARGN protein, partial [Hylia prasina]|nr:LARGN protein [Hylia prasina]
QVVDQIDTLTCDLQLEDEMTDSSKTDTLNSSSSSTTASSLEKVKVRGSVVPAKPPAHPSAILTPARPPAPANPLKTNGTLLRNGGLPVAPGRVPNGDVCCSPGTNLEKVVMQPLVHRPEKERCPQPGARERVRFSEKVQYHGYCPDCDVRYNIKNREVHLHGESARAAGKLPHQCPPLPPPPPPLPPFLLENGGLGISPSNSFPPPRPATVPPQTAPKPQKTILRKSTTTTV